jgi:hypothetical protein
LRPLPRARTEADIVGGPVGADIVEKLHNCEAAGIAGPFDATRLRCCEAFGHCRDDQLGELAKVLSGGCK